MTIKTSDMGTAGARVEPQVAVGDLNSDERGSGARMNGDKVPMHYIPVSIWIQKWLDAGILRKENYLYESLIQLHAAVVRQVPFSRLVDHLHDTWLDDACKVFKFGAGKYAPNNWMKGMPWAVPLGCALRHAKAIIVDKEITDPDSGLPHTAHYSCNIVMLAHYEKYYPEGNDLPDPKYFTTGEM